ncbi:MAG TPA: hypothetical protein PKD26_09545 [Pyrinomonadaceae bacterium]|nr:hypothetical protein [Pyrinomonadaceae bacterium]
MSNTISIPIPENFDLRLAIEGHGWYDLLPFSNDSPSGTLRYVFESRASGPVSISLYLKKGRIVINTTGSDRNETKLVVRRVLRMDEELDSFYETIESHLPFEWVARKGAGRLLRSATVFEDLVKTLCTTNCSWGLTRKMVTNLVDRLGRPAPDGRRAFPTSEALAACSTDFFRDEIRAGYRSPYLHELGNSVASGQLDPETWLTSELPTPDLKKEIMKVKGMGSYAADNLLKLLGRYDGLALDSWLRSGFYKKHNRSKVCPDTKIEKHYRKFGEWKGLAIWCDMTESWFSENDQQ